MRCCVSFQRSAAISAAPVPGGRGSPQMIDAIGYVHGLQATRCHGQTAPKQCHIVAVLVDHLSVLLCQLLRFWVFQHRAIRFVVAIDG
ncbi:hypothetical protein OR60_22405 [Xanthomonas vesicatoria]|nr:hypothetical protein OR60_22405 [Xanthomonas vesicatoria]